MSIPQPQKDEQGKVIGDFYPLQEAELLALHKIGAINNAGYVYLALRLEKADEQYIDVDTFAAKWDIPKSSVYEAITKINQSDIAFTVKVKTPNKVEGLIRDRLQDELGGFIEVATPVGRVDLLTKTQIIEVKHFKDWKAALGQILVYSAFYPEHQKRIHLFGTAAELAKLADIQAACLGFDVLVTGEVCNE